MNKKRIVFFFLVPVLFLVFFLVGKIATAQQDQVADAGTTGNGFPAGLSSCGTYFSFDSLAARFGISDTIEVEAGKILGNPISVENFNKAPLNEVKVYVSIFKDGNNAEEKFQLAQPIAIITVAENLSFAVGEEKSLNFSWQVPKNLEDGLYHASIYVSAHERFNVFGSSFTEDNPTTKAIFKVTGGGGKALRFDQDNVLVGEAKYDFTKGQIKIDPAISSVDINVSLKNDSDDAIAKGNIAWQLYGSANATDATLLETSKHNLKLLPGLQTKLSYQIRDMRYSDYLLLGKLSTEVDSDSVIVLRICKPLAQVVLSEQAAGRKFTLKKGAPAFLACW